jgi:hypothetical protein
VVDPPLTERPRGGDGVTVVGGEKSVKSPKGALQSFSSGGPSEKPLRAAGLCPAPERPWAAAAAQWAAGHRFPRSRATDARKAPRRGGADSPLPRKTLRSAPILEEKRSMDRAPGWSVSVALRPLEDEGRARGLDWTAQIHLGSRVRELEGKGVRLERRDGARRVGSANAEREALLQAPEGEG